MKPCKRVAEVAERVAEKSDPLLPRKTLILLAFSVLGSRGSREVYKIECSR